MNILDSKLLPHYPLHGTSCRSNIRCYPCRQYDCYRGGLQAIPCSIQSLIQEKGFLTLVSHKIRLPLACLGADGIPGILEKAWTSRNLPRPRPVWRICAPNTINVSSLSRQIGGLNPDLNRWQCRNRGRIRRDGRRGGRGKRGRLCAITEGIWIFLTS